MCLNIYLNVDIYYIAYTVEPTIPIFEIRHPTDPFCQEMTIALVMLEVINHITSANTWTFKCQNFLEWKNPKAKPIQ